MYLQYLTCQLKNTVPLLDFIIIEIILIIFITISQVT